MPQQAPPGATHLVVVAARFEDESPVGVGIELVDWAPPTAQASYIDFADTDMTYGEVGGMITIGRAADEEGLVSYRAYWSSASGDLGALIGSAAVGDGSGDLAVAVTEGSAIPMGASHITVVTRNSQDDALMGISVPIVDAFVAGAPLGLAFEDTDADLDAFGGAVTLMRAVNETSVMRYEIYWGAGEADGDPTLSEKFADVNLTSSFMERVLVMMSDEYGDGWLGDSMTITSVSTGMTVASGLTCQRYWSNVTLDLLPGMYTVHLDVQSWPQEASWEIYVCPATGHIDITLCTFIMRGGSPSDMTVEIPNLYAVAPTDDIDFDSMPVWGPETIAQPLAKGTAKPSGATHLLVYSRGDDGTLSSTGASTPLRDWAPPTSLPADVAFADTDVRAGYIEGTMTFLSAPDESRIDYYRATFGSESCGDTPEGWSDRWGYSCKDYVDQWWCTASGGYGEGWEMSWGSFADYAVDGTPANTACCGCGGGGGAQVEPIMTRWESGVMGMYWAYAQVIAPAAEDAGPPPPTVARTDVAINFTASSWDLFPTEYFTPMFGVQWIGFIKIGTPGMYTVVYEGGMNAMFMVNGQYANVPMRSHMPTMIDTPVTRQVQAYLSVGYHNFTVSQLTQMQGPGATLMYAGPDTEGGLVQVPPSVLFHAVEDESQAPEIGRVAASGADSAMTLEIPASEIVPGASVILLYAVSEDYGESVSPVQISILDMAIPTCAPESVFFADMDNASGKYEGFLTFERCKNEAAVTRYLVYFGDNATHKLAGSEVLGTLAAGDAQDIGRIYLNFSASDIPATGTYLVVVAASDTNEASQATGVQLVDFVSTDFEAFEAQFVDTDPSRGRLGGTVTVVSAADTDSVESYKVYFGSGPHTKVIPGMPGLKVEYFLVSGSGEAELAHTQVEMVPFENVGVILGMVRGAAIGHWTGSLYISNPGHYTFTLVAAHAARLKLGGQTVAENDNALVEVPQVSTMLLASGSIDLFLEYNFTMGENMAWVFPRLTLAYSGPDTGFETVYPGDNLRHGSDGGMALGTIPADDPVVTLSGNVSIPAEASYVLVFPVDYAGQEGNNPAAVAIVDLVRPEVGPLDVIFTDDDPICRQIGGELLLAELPDESSISHYHVYWGNGTATKLPGEEVPPGRLLTSASHSRNTLPCDGPSCDLIMIESLGGGHWEVSRRYHDNNEEAYITLVGPGMVTFTFLDLESCCDRLSFWGEREVTGAILPEPFEVPEGKQVVHWYSDYSVTGDGWTFEFERRGGGGGGGGGGWAPVPDDVVINSTAYIGSIVAGQWGERERHLQIPGQEVPANATHLLVYAAWGLSETAEPTSLPIIDYCPPENHPSAADFVDTDEGLNVIGGELLISAPVNDTGVTDYAVYWGMNSTTKASMAVPGLLAEYFALDVGTERLPNFDDLDPVLERVEPSVFHTDTEGEWFEGMPFTDWFAARWTGNLVISESGSYWFYMGSNDGSRLTIDSQVVIDHDGLHDSLVTESGYVWLQAGLHNILVEYFEAEGMAGIYLGYMGEDTRYDLVELAGDRLSYNHSNFIGRVAKDSDLVTMTIAAGTQVLGATHLLVYSEGDLGVSYFPAAVEIRDMANPTHGPDEVEFLDLNPEAGVLTGNLTITRAENESMVTDYHIYWGSNATAKLEGSEMLDAVSRWSTGGGGGGGGDVRLCGQKGLDDTPIWDRRLSSGFDPKIVNGQDTTPCEHRWQVSLRAQGWGHFCGGTLIGPRTVLTASHCIDGDSGPNPSLYVVLGDFDKDSESDPHQIEVAVSNAIMHPEYNSNTMTHDIAILQLATEVPESECIGYACIPSEPIPDGATCEITGWGTLASGGATPSNLQEAEVQVINNDVCNDDYGGQIDDTMLCANGRSPNGGVTDACQGDSGGPLVCRGADGSYEIHGATSWGRGCADPNYPGVWAKVTEDLLWIEEVSGLAPGGSGVPMTGEKVHASLDQIVPDGATHLLVFSGYNGGESKEGASTKIHDYNPPTELPLGVYLIDQDATPGELGGNLWVACAANEEELEGYNVYWGSSPTDKQDFIGFIPRCADANDDGNRWQFNDEGYATNASLNIPVDTMMPANASYFLAYSLSSGGESVAPIAGPVTDWVSVHTAGSIKLIDTEPDRGLVGGVVTIQRAYSEGRVMRYALYWGIGGRCQKANDIPVATLYIDESAGGAPRCEGISCPVIDITPLSALSWDISRGMSGYDNNEFAVMYLSGPGNVEFTRFSTEESYDYLWLLGYGFSGQDLPQRLDVPEGLHEVFWGSDNQGTADGWSFTFTKENTVSTAEIPLDGTTMPDGARLMVMSEREDGETLSGCASVRVTDYAPPQEVPLGVSFQDVDPEFGFISGEVTVHRGSWEPGNITYKIYFGKIQGSGSDGYWVRMSDEPFLTISTGGNTGGGGGGGWNNRLLSQSSAPPPPPWAAASSARGKRVAAKAAAKAARGFATECVDSVGWTDSLGDECYIYEAQQWCLSDGSYGPGWGSDWGTFDDYAVSGISAVDACCACGGGSTSASGNTPAMTPDVDVEGGINIIDDPPEDLYYALNFTAQIEARTEVPEGATAFLVFASNRTGEFNYGRASPIRDYAPPAKMPLDATFMDMDPTKGFLAGILSIKVAYDPLATEYVVFQEEEMLGAAQVLAQKPTVDGPSSNLISIVRDGSAWEIERGREGYTSNEMAVITISGPGLLSFEFFNTESGYDFVEVMGESYSGNYMPPDIEIPEGLHEMRWWSDGSVEYEGWACRYKSSFGGTAEVYLANLSVPETGSLPVMVYSKGPGGMMADGLATALRDWAPPTVVAEAVSFQDENLGIGIIGGRIRVTRAADDVAQGVFYYNVYFGSSATKKVEEYSTWPIGVADATVSGEQDLTIAVYNQEVPLEATHLLVFASAENSGEALTPAATEIVDETGLLIEQTAVYASVNKNDGSPGVITEQVVLRNTHTDMVELRANLQFESGIANMRSFGFLADDDDARSANPTAGIPEPKTGGTCKASPPKKDMKDAEKKHGRTPESGRVIFSWKAEAKGDEGRRLRSRRLSKKYGVKRVKELSQLHMAWAEVPEGGNASLLLSQMKEDQDIAWAEEDKVIRFFDPPGHPLFGKKNKGAQPRSFPVNKHTMPRCSATSQSCAAREEVPVMPEDPDFSSLWGLDNYNDADIDAPEAWAIHTGLNRRSIVAVIDTGIDYEHEDLAEQMWRNEGEIPGNGIDDDGNGYVDDVFGYDFGDDDGDPMDTYGHGTHCAGTIGAEARNGFGVVGVSWGAKLMALKLDGADSLSAFVSAAVQALDYAIMMGAKISSNSWGFGDVPSTALSEALTAAEQAGHLFVCAAANDFTDNDEIPMYPCNYEHPNVLCVAATDSQDDLAYFSNWGLTSVDMAAPGVDILSTVPGGRYEYKSGTSMATPHVAGAAALIEDFVPQLSAMEIKQILMDTGDFIDRLEGKLVTGKRLNIHQALIESRKYLWATLESSSIIVPPQGEATVWLTLGGNEVELGEYRALLTLSKGAFSSSLPVVFTVHEYSSAPSVGAQAAEFMDKDPVAGILYGQVTISRADYEIEHSEISQYLIYWGKSATERLDVMPPDWPKVVDIGHSFFDDFASFDAHSWHAEFSTGWSVQDGYIRFSGPFDKAHLSFVRTPSAPFYVKTRVMKAPYALSGFVAQIGGEEGTPALFKPGTGVQVALLGGFKTVMLPGGVVKSKACTPSSSWYYLEVRVEAGNLIFRDDQGCEDLSVNHTLAGPQQVILGAHSSEDSYGVAWDSVEVSGGSYAVYCLQTGTVMPADATHLLVYSANVVGEVSDIEAVSVPVNDLFIPDASAPPMNVMGTAVSKTEISLSWERSVLHDCSFVGWEVMGVAAESEAWFVPDGCQSLPNHLETTCVASGLTSNTPYQFKVRATCEMSEANSPYSDLSMSTVTAPTRAFAPSQVATHLPTSDSMLVVWRTNSLNDCEFEQSFVEGKSESGDWFVPEGCTELISLNSYMCTAMGLAPSTSYTFRVTTQCTDGTGSSEPSEVTEAKATLAADGSGSSAGRRALFANVGVSIPYETWRADPAMQTTVMAQIKAIYAERLGVSVDDIMISVSEAEASGGRRLLTSTAGKASTRFEIMVRLEAGSLESQQSVVQLLDNDQDLATEVNAALAAMTGSEGDATTVVMAKSVLRTVASAPSAVNAQVNGMAVPAVTVSWSLQALNDCAFLAYNVLGHDKTTGASFTPTGCDMVVDFATTSCTATGLTSGRQYSFTVSVLCANPECSSPASTASPGVYIGIGCPAPTGIANAAAGGACEEGDMAPDQGVCTTACAEGFHPSPMALACAAGALTPATFSCLPTTATGDQLPELLGAEFSDSFTAITLSFRHSVYFCEAPPCDASDDLEVPCEGVLAAEVVAKLGAGPTCSLNTNRVSLSATLGAGATIAPGDQVATKAGTLFSALPSSAGATGAGSLTAELQQGADFIGVTASVSATKDQVLACSDLGFAGSVEVGDFGRPLASFSWSLGQATPEVMRQYLQPSIDAANSAGTRTVNISRTSLFMASKAVRASQDAATVATVELQVEVTNWLGGTGVATRAVSVTAEQEPMPVLLPDGETELSGARGETLELAVLTQSPQLSECQAAAAVEQASVPQVVITWHYRADGEEAWRTLEQSSDGGSQEPLDRAPSPNLVRFAPFTFEASSVHHLKATAAYSDSPPDTSGSWPEVLFTVTVLPPVPPSAVLAGPSSAPKGCDWALDASASMDPAAAPGEAVQLAYRWSCSPSCDAVVADQTEPMLSVAANALDAGIYSFTVEVTRSGAGEAGVAMLEVTITESAAPPVTVQPAAWASLPGGARVSTQALSNPIAATITGSANCPIADSWVFSWVLFAEQAGSAVAALQTRSVAEGGIKMEVSASVMPAGVLTAGTRYIYGLVYADGAAKLDQLLADMQSLNLEDSAAVLAHSPPFLADAPPSGGLVQANPVSGEAVKTKFAASTSGWTDSEQDMNDIEYHFYRFPLASGTELTVDGSGAVSAAPEFSLPEIEWADADSDRYWTKLGGRPLRGWDASPEAPSFVMPAGNYFLVARARDPLGGASSAWALGPKVVTTASLSDEDVLMALSGPLASNDADQILNTLSSVGDADSSGGEAQTQMLLQALETAVGVQDAGDESTQKVSQVVQDLIGGSAGSTMGPDDLARASVAVEQSIDAALALGDDFGGLSKGAGEAALGSAAAVVDGLSTTVGTSDNTTLEDSDVDAAEAATSKFESLVSKIGQAAVQGLEEGESQELSAVDESGVGPVMALAKSRIDDSGGASTNDGLSLPSGWADGSTRRLQSSSCSALSVQQTEWRGSNPFWWAPKGVGLNSFVAKDATVKTLELRNCDSTSASRQGVSFELAVRLPAEATSGGELKCAFFDAETRSWTDDGVSLVSKTTDMATCESTQGAGSYTVLYWTAPTQETLEDSAFTRSSFLPFCLATLVVALTAAAMET